jgi:hypothetical protein
MNDLARKTSPFPHREIRALISHDAAKWYKEEGYPQILKPGVMFYDSDGRLCQSKVFETDLSDELVVIPAGKEYYEWCASWTQDPKEAAEYSAMAAWTPPPDIIETMTYVLAKELRDAGFPQALWTGNTYYPHANGVVYIWTEDPEPYELEDTGSAKVPSLSELIEACGDKFLSLVKDKEYGWLARDAIEGNAPILGSNPEEAVAWLWLALNCKGVAGNRAR